MTDHGVLPGDRVEVHHHGHWLPFLVTHLAEDGGLDGVAFSGRYPAHNWSRPVMDVRNAKRADDAGEPVQATWRPAPGPSLNAIVEAAVDARMAAAIAAIPVVSAVDLAGQADPPAKKAAPAKKASAKKAPAKDGS